MTTNFYPYVRLKYNKEIWDHEKIPSAEVDFFHDDYLDIIKFINN